MSSPRRSSKSHAADDGVARGKPRRQQAQQPQFPAKTSGSHDNELERVKAVAAAAIALKNMAGPGHQPSSSRHLEDAGDEEEVGRHASSSYASAAGVVAGEAESQRRVAASSAASSLLPSPAATTSAMRPGVAADERRADAGQKPGDVDEHDEEEEDDDEEDVRGSLLHMNFPRKLMQALEDPKLSNILSWLPHGKSFFIMNPKKFSTQVLPRYFNKKAEYRSFTRRLLRWGFHRISKGNETGAYYHELFQRDKPHLCSQIITKHKPVKKSKADKKKPVAPPSAPAAPPSSSTTPVAPSPSATEAERKKYLDRKPHHEAKRLKTSSVSSFLCRGESSEMLPTTTRLPPSTPGGDTDERQRTRRRQHLSDGGPPLPQHMQNEILSAAAAAAAGRADASQMELLIRYQRQQQAPPSPPPLPPQGDTSPSRGLAGRIDEGVGLREQHKQQRQRQRPQHPQIPQSVAATAAALDQHRRATLRALQEGTPLMMQEGAEAGSGIPSHLSSLPLDIGGLGALSPLTRHLLHTSPFATTSLLATGANLPQPHLNPLLLAQQNRRGGFPETAQLMGGRAGLGVAHHPLFAAHSGLASSVVAGPGQTNTSAIINAARGALERSSILADSGGRAAGLARSAPANEDYNSGDSDVAKFDGSDDTRRPLSSEAFRHERMKRRRSSAA